MTATNRSQKDTMALSKEDEEPKWDIKVDDFDRPVAGLSLSWDVLPEDFRLRDETWERIILMDNDLDVAHILSDLSLERSPGLNK